MIRSNQKWYDKPITKLILVSIALTWMFPLFGFVLSSFRPGESPSAFPAGGPEGLLGQQQQMFVAQQQHIGG